MFRRAALLPISWGGWGLNQIGKGVHGQSPWAPLPILWSGWHIARTHTQSEQSEQPKAFDGCGRSRIHILSFSESCHDLPVLSLSVQLHLDPSTCQRNHERFFSHDYSGIGQTRSLDAVAFRIDIDASEKCVRQMQWGAVSTA